MPRSANLSSAKRRASPSIPPIASSSRSERGSKSNCNPQKPRARTPSETAEVVANASSSSVAAPEAEESVEAKPKVNLRGSDGHISLSKLMANKPSGGTGSGMPKGSRSTRGIGMGMGMKKKQQASGAGGGSSAANLDEAQRRFTGAKSISSAQFHGSSKEEDLEKRQRLSKFHGATSISSADYYGNSEGSPRSDMDSSELIGKLSLQAKMDVENLKGLATKAKSKIFDFARDMQNRYS